jgi:hypothetical protein
MTIQRNNGIIDYRDNGRYFSPGTNDWSVVTSWVDFDNWNKNPISTLYLLTDKIDLGQIETVNIIANLSARGTAHYYIYYNSTTSVFNDSTVNYTTLHVTNGMTAIPSITARYIWLVLALDYDATQGFQYFDNINYRASSEAKTLRYSNLSSSSYSGSASDRLITLGSTIGGVKNSLITSRGSATYNVDMYVARSTTSNKTYPEIISTGTNGIHLTFIGIDGASYDSTFDMQVDITPEWYMDSTGNLKER